MEYDFFKHYSRNNKYRKRNGNEQKTCSAAYPEEFRGRVLSRESTAMRNNTKKEIAASGKNMKAQRTYFVVSAFVTSISVPETASLDEFPCCLSQN
jgi:hypothetical protein